MDFFLSIADTIHAPWEERELADDSQSIGVMVRTIGSRTLIGYAKVLCASKLIDHWEKEMVRVMWDAAQARMM